MWKIVALLLLLIGGTAAAGTLASFPATVVGITDGDTVKVLTRDKRQIRVRLAEIDAPESHQPYGEKSRQELARLVFSREVQVRPETIDRYGRTVAHLSVRGQDASIEMVRRGAAWVYTRYSTDPALPALERAARIGRVGLWALQPDQRQPPWEWRQSRRSGAAKPSGTGTRQPALRQELRTGPSAFSCGAKRYCSQMGSCEEAIYHLRICGLKRLDGNHDGKPCERLCG